MKAVIQRVTSASVSIENEIYNQINQGLLLLIGVEQEDLKEDADYLIQKISNLRIFSDSEGKMNLSIQEIQGEFLVISQFTLHASTKKGNRPSFIKAARPEVAIPLYEYFCETLKMSSNLVVKTGKFAADMKISLINDGPVTILIDSKNRE
jgi:D-tyrosyl-tRNA(Tyr) deacylase